MNRVPVILQSERNECGLAALSMVVSNYDHSWDLATLRHRFGSNPRGTNLKRLLEYAQVLGYGARGLRLEVEQLGSLRRPAILHWQLDHFVVLVAVKKKSLIVHDPAVGRRNLSWSEVSECFTGIALEVWPGQQCSASEDRQRLDLRSIWHLVRGASGGLGWILSLAVLLQALLLMAPWHVQWLVDYVLVAGDEHLIELLAGAFAGLLLIRVGVNWLRSLLVVHLGHALSYVFATAFLHHLIHLPLPWFTARSVGDIASRFNSLPPVKEFFTQGAAVLMVDSLIVVLSLVLMLVYAPVLAAVVVAAHLVATVVHLVCVPRLRQLNMSTLVAQGQEQSHLIETIRAIHSVKVYGQEGERHNRWQKLYDRTLKHSADLQRAQAGLSVLSQFCSGLELIAVATLAAYAILLEQALTIGMLFAFLSYRSHFGEKLSSVVQMVVQVKTLKSHLLRLEDVWLVEPETAAIKQEYNFDGSITVRSLCFRYGADEPWVLRDADLAVRPGEFVAIVGASGVGKSTLLKLLMGLQPPSEGQIMAGQQPIKGESALALRQVCGCVLQEDGFVSGSILENLALGRTCTDDDIWRVLAQVEMASTVQRLPLGIRTHLGDIDSQFSSGQIQRLLLARALFRSPKYLFLDEGTAHLDRGHADAIERLVCELPITRLVITHSESFARRADRIVTLQEGRLVEAREVKDLATELESLAAG